jgi:hypothetical protein
MRQDSKSGENLGKQRDKISSFWKVEYSISHSIGQFGEINFEISFIQDTTFLSNAHAN